MINEEVIFWFIVGNKIYLLWKYFALLDLFCEANKVSGEYSHLHINIKSGKHKLFSLFCSETRRSS